jgi:cell division protease FtsH
MAQAKKPNPIKLPKKKAAKSGPKKPLTRSQRILRGPLFWIIAAIVAVTVFGQITNAGNQ